MATLTDVKEYLGVEDDFTYDTLLGSCLATAQTLVNQYVGVAEVPNDVLDLAYIIVAVDLFSRREAPNGVMNQQFITADGVPSTPVRIARNPLAGVTALLRPWVLPF